MVQILFSSKNIYIAKSNLDHELILLQNLYKWFSAICTAFSLLLFFLYCWKSNLSYSEMHHLVDS